MFDAKYFVSQNRMVIVPCFAEREMQGVRFETRGGWRLRKGLSLRLRRVAESSLEEVIVGVVEVRLAQQSRLLNRSQESFIEASVEEALGRLSCHTHHDPYSVLGSLW